jgi:hypothetical protein
MPRGGLPQGAGSGYVYDWIRRRQNQSEENRRQRRKMKKRIKKRTMKRKKERQGEPNKLSKAIENFERRIKEKNLQGIK